MAWSEKPLNGADASLLIVNTGVAVIPNPQKADGQKRLS
jgi:hypothetical protein